ncbi:MAG TPA: hypothetical protein VM942_01775 [Acidimicrobiales bacterium]|nr:hypothetical protein [Acidimicrobiales bacterium]
MVRRSRLFEWATFLCLLTVLSTAITVVVLRSVIDKEDEYPAAWDPRVLELTQFVERERGALFDHPVPVDFLTPEEYSEQTRTDEGMLTEEERTEIEQFEGALRAMGILSGDTDLLDASNDLTDSGTLAYYDSAEERVVVRGTEVTPSLAVTLVHELTHVLQDQVFFLDRYVEGDEEPTSGETYAFDSLVEGDADRIDRRYLETLDQAVQESIDEENAAGLEEFEDAGIPVALSSLFGSMYGLGDAFVAVLESAAGESVDGAFDDPPISEEQVFDPFAYLESDGPDEVEAPDTDGEEAFDEGDFGAVSLLIVLAERIDPRAALAAATGWGGDAFAVFPRDGRTCIQLNVTGDTPEDTAELEEAVADWVAAVPGDSASTARDGDVVFLESCDPGTTSAAGTGGSRTAVELAVTRSYVAASALDEGADVDQARCFGAAVVDGLSDEELLVDELSAASERKVARFAAGCR